MRKLRTTFTAVAVAATVTVAPVAAEELSTALITADFEVPDFVSGSLASLAQVDLSWISKYHLGLNVDLANTAGKVDVELNDTPIGTILGYVNQEDMMLYLQAPELSENYLSVNLKDAIERAEAENGGLVSLNMNGQPLNMGAVMDEETQEKALEFLMNYGFPFLGALEAGESSTETVSYKDQTAEIMYDGFTANAADFLDVLEEQITALKDDQETIDFLNSIMSNGIEITGEILDQAIEEIEKANTEDMASVGVQINYGFSEDNVAMAGNLALVNGEEAMKIAEFVGFSGDSGMGGYVSAGMDEVSFRVDFDFNAEGFVGDLYIGEAGVAELKFEPGDKSGTITISPIAEEENSLLAGFEGAALVINYADEGERAFANIEIRMSTISLAKLELAAAAGETMEVPDLSGVTAYDAMNEDDLNTFMGTMDPTVLMEKLTAAGFGAEEEE